jgi:acyl dehydratase
MMGVGSPHIRSGQYWLAYRKQSPKVAVRDPETNIFQAVERVHWDPFMAAEIGMPAPYDYGSQRGAWASHLMTNWASDAGWVAEVDVQYRGMNFLGDTVWVKGEVTGKWVGETSGIGFVDCRIEGINQRGDNIMPGRAIVALPTRDRPLPNGPIDPDAERPRS